MHFNFLRWFSQDAWMAADHRMLQCSQTPACRTELGVQQKSWGHHTKDSQHTSGSSHFQRPGGIIQDVILPDLSSLFQSPRDGFAEHVWWGEQEEGACEWGAHGSCQRAGCMWHSGHDKYNNIMFPFVLKLPTIISGMDVPTQLAQDHKLLKTSLVPLCILMWCIIFCPPNHANELHGCLVFFFVCLFFSQIYRKERHWSGTFSSCKFQTHLTCTSGPKADDLAEKLQDN